MNGKSEGLRKKAFGFLLEMGRRWRNEVEAVLTYKIAYLVQRNEDLHSGAFFCILGKHGNKKNRKQTHEALCFK